MMGRVGTHHYCHHYHHHLLLLLVGCCFLLYSDTTSASSSFGSLTTSPPPTLLLGLARSPIIKWPLSLLSLLPTLLLWAWWVDLLVCSLCLIHCMLFLRWNWLFLVTIIIMQAVIDFKWCMWNGFNVTCHGVREGVFLHKSRILAIWFVCLMIVEPLILATVCNRCMFGLSFSVLYEFDLPLYNIPPKLNRGNHVLSCCV